MRQIDNMTVGKLRFQFVAKGVVSGKQDATTRTESNETGRAPETVLCERCHMNVWKTRVEHHRTWCNPRLEVEEKP